MSGHGIFTTWNGTPGEPDVWCTTCGTPYNQCTENKMTDIPDEAVQALARMINPDAWESYDLLTKPDEAEYREYIVRHSLAQATEYLTAAAPIIRADERRRVLDLLPLPAEDARSGMIHARTLITAERIYPRRYGDEDVEKVAEAMKSSRGHDPEAEPWTRYSEFYRGLARAALDALEEK